MAETLNGETLPLLGLSRSHRIHYLDNLRATLTVLLIFHHAATLSSAASSSRELLIPTFILVNKSALWGLFFFVSGRSTALSLVSKSDYDFILSKTLNIAVPAWLYAVIGHPLLFMVLSLGWEKIFGGYNQIWAYSRLSGPVAYVFILLVLDYLCVLVRWSKRHWPEVVPSSIFASFRPTSQSHFRQVAALLTGGLIIFTFLRSLGFQIAPYFLYIIQSYDYPGPDAPLSFVTAYLAGVNFDSIKEYLIMDLAPAYRSLFISLFLSYLSMALYFSSFFWRPSAPYFLLHDVILALWSTFVFFAVPIPLISIFSQGSWATREWGFLARHTYVQMYINMVPIQVATYFLLGIRDSLLKTLLAGGFGVAASWVIMLAWMILWGYVVRIGKRYVRPSSSV